MRFHVFITFTICSELYAPCTGWFSFITFHSSYSIGWSACKSQTKGWQQEQELVCLVVYNWVERPRRFGMRAYLQVLHPDFVFGFRMRFRSCSGGDIKLALDSIMACGSDTMSLNGVGYLVKRFTSSSIATLNEKRMRCNQ